MTDQTEPAGATPGDDTSGLILTHLATRAERNAAEAEAIRTYLKIVESVKEVSIMPSHAAIA